MAFRSSSLLTATVLAVCAFALLSAGSAFLPVGAPASSKNLRGDTTAAAVAIAGLAAAGAPHSAEAFVYKGKEYFDVLFGIDPLWWGTLIFGLIYCGAVLKNALRKYYKPFPKDAPPPKVGKFLGKEKEVLKWGGPGAGNPEVSDGSQKPPTMQEGKIWF